MTGRFQSRSTMRIATAVLLAFLGVAVGRGEETAGGDRVEFLSGTTLQGTVVEIRKEAKELVFSSQIAGKEISKVYPYANVHAVTYRGKRFVLTPHDATERAVDPLDSNGQPRFVSRTKAEIEQLIARVGPTRPAWYVETPLVYPDSLDLLWPEPEGEPWNNQKNVGQYIWDIINPNEAKWKQGIRLLDHLLTLEPDDLERQTRIQRAIAGMYFRFFQDYPRAAYWWREANVSPRSGDGIALAECYFQLGNRQMAMEALDTDWVRIGLIKLLGQMGETEMALRAADTYAISLEEPQWVYLAAGDAARQAENFPAAIAYYQRVLDSAPISNPQYDARARQRAQQSMDAISLFQLFDIQHIEDGTYVSDSLGYEGPVEVEVETRDHRIVAVKVVRHREKQFYSALRDVPQQIVAKQNVKDVQATSGATITAEAIVSATAKALRQAVPRNEETVDSPRSAGSPRSSPAKKP